MVRELIHDTRKMMLPFTALKLKEKKSNSLKDFVSIAGSLGVSHLMCFTTTETVIMMHTACMFLYITHHRLSQHPIIYLAGNLPPPCKDAPGTHALL